MLHRAKHLKNTWDVSSHSRHVQQARTAGTLLRCPWTPKENLDTNATFGFNSVFPRQNLKIGVEVSGKLLGGETFVFLEHLEP